MSTLALRASLRLWRWRLHRHHDKQRAAKQRHDTGEVARLAGLIRHDEYMVHRRTVQLGARETPKVATPITKILADTWGWHPGVHDGMDLICEPNATLFAMVEGDIVRADTGGWWGKSPSGDVSKGDGIIILRCTVDVGPFKKGLNICYGHAEHPKVKAGDHVKAGQAIGLAGLAVAWHTHLMVNGRADTRGVGDRDPRPYYDYARQHAG